MRRKRRTRVAKHTTVEEDRYKWFCNAKDNYILPVITFSMIKSKYEEILGTVNQSSKIEVNESLVRRFNKRYWFM